MSNIDDIYAEARAFASDDIGRAYLIIRMARDWQKETGGTLDELLDYIDKMCPKKQ